MREVTQRTCLFMCVCVCVCVCVYIYANIYNAMTSLVAQMVKHLSTMWETWVQSLGQEDSLEKEMATYSSTLAQKITWKEEAGVHGVAKSQTQLSDFTYCAYKLNKQDDNIQS